MRTSGRWILKYEKINFGYQSKTFPLFWKTSQSDPQMVNKKTLEYMGFWLLVEIKTRTSHMDLPKLKYSDTFIYWLLIVLAPNSSVYDGH